MKMANGILCLSASALVVATASAEINLSEYLRTSGEGSVTASWGADTSAAAGTAAGCFDGDFTTDAGRALMVRGNAADPRSTVVEFTLSPSSHPEATFVLSSFSVWRIHSGSHNYITRTAREFRLEANDGSGWKLLYATGAKQTWDADTANRVYEIPVAARVEARDYRFVVVCDYQDAEADTYAVGIQELELFGDIVRRLSWNGADGEPWDSASQNWKTVSGADAAWTGGAISVFGTNGTRSVNVDGISRLSGITFGSGGARTLSGGTLAFVHDAEVKAGYGDVISCAITNIAPSDSGHTGYLPANPGNLKEGLPVLLWKDRKLSDITGFTSAILNQNNDATVYNATACLFKNYGLYATAQFQALVGTSPLLGVKVLFTQSGSDIYAKILYSKYYYGQGARTLGEDLDATGTSVNVRDGSTNIGAGYGLKDIVAIGDSMSAPSLSVDFGCDGANDYAGTYLPRSAGDSKTGEAVIYWRGKSIADLKGISAGSMCYNGADKDTSVCFFTNSGSAASAQFQGNMSATGARLCVKVEFTQSGGDILARVVYARYNWDNLGEQDFDLYPRGNTDVYDDNNANGYGVKNIVGDFAGRLSVSGTFDVAGDVSVNGGTISFEAGAPVLRNDFVGDGTVRFAPAAGTQAVLVAGARTLGNVVFGGTVALNFDAGSSLEIAAAELEPGAMVEIGGSFGRGRLRIGTSRCLARDVLGRISFCGKRVRQDVNGWIAPMGGFVMSVH